MQREAIVFSRQLMTVIIEHERLVSKHLRSVWALGYNEFTLLLALLESGQAQEVQPLCDYLMLQKPTIIGLLSLLEEHGHIKKTVGCRDRRLMQVELTQQGIRFVRDARESTLELIDKVFTSGLSTEVSKRLLYSRVRSTNDALRGFEIASFKRNEGQSTPLCADYLVYWRTMVSRWTRAVMDGAALSLGEYRILDYLIEFDSANPRDIAEQLIMQRSNVSLYNRRLVERRMVKGAPDPFDGRSMILRITKEGAQTVSELAADLGKLTQLGHQGLSAEALMTLNVWYMQMYCNLRRYIDGR